ncbi:putative pentatricopeptide repeat-containing protein At3g01580 [Selaginella moellendorffii]|uniref:putative pentatricopeptide repeat-containing protein At3g01580 n=1 Tax=Selaginella moellendorffii TaxID=88036 RepID=UPI000D1C98AA|nr:putative pentatricopeptide repeat-containing protein At3g01580 [Selaginella moellendorffii]|eukprot:XP_024542905.1 putative pentatricopeptide repeat-containing protein At3g01580 [Selaginella moellendorffii]
MSRRKAPASFVAALKSCVALAAKEEGAKVDDGKLVKLRALERGISIHARATCSGCDADAFVSCSLMEMYAKCGRMVEARAVFDKLLRCSSILPSVVLWTVLIQGYTENGEPCIALDLFSRMKEENYCQPNPRTIVPALKACSLLAAEEVNVLDDTVERKKSVIKRHSLRKGMEIHAQALEQGFHSDIFVSNTLVHMYAKCGSMVDARRVFDRALDRSTVSWNILMLGYVEHGEAGLVLELFSCMERSGAAPNALSFVAALKACTSLADEEQGTVVDGGKLVKVRALEDGMAVHAQALEAGYYNSDAFVSNALIDMYCNCGRMVEAKRVFDELHLQRTVVSWNALMLGYVENGEEESALQALAMMEGCNCVPTSRTFLAALKACSGLAAKEEAGEESAKLESLERGMAIHSRAEKQGLGVDLFVASTLVDMYSKCGSMLDARRVFDRMEKHSSVAWTALILGYTEKGDSDLALELFASMQQENCPRDAPAFVAALKACAAMAAREESTPVDQKLVKSVALEKVAEIHPQAIASGLISDLYLASSLVDLYASCGSMEDARSVYDKMPRHDVVSWASLVLGYAESGQAELALELFFRTRVERSHECASNAVSFVGALKACGSLTALETGKRRVHGDLCRSGLELESTVVANSLVDFYGKCACLIQSQHMFDSIVRKDAASWTSLLAGYCRQGNVSRALELFHAMQHEDGLRPTPVTFTCLLTACSHAGLVDQGKKLFQLMLSKYGVRPTLEHYHCLADLLGRANRVAEAVTLLETMPYSPTAVSWRTMLSACRKWDNIELGKRAYESLMDLSVKDTAGYSLIRNLYGSTATENHQIIPDESHAYQAKLFDLQVRSA